MQRLSSCYEASKLNGIWPELNHYILLIGVCLGSSCLDIGLSALLVLGLFIRKILESPSHSLLEAFGQK